MTCATCDGERKLYCDGCGGHLCKNPTCQDPECPDPHYCPDDCDGTTPDCPDCVKNDIADAIRSEAVAASRPGQYERLMALAKFVDKMEAAPAELEALRRWKAEALEVLDQWYRVADAVESVTPCPLGHSRVEHARRFVVAAARRHA